MNVQRYDFTDSKGRHLLPSMATMGEWVRWADVEPIITAATRCPARSAVFGTPRCTLTEGHTDAHHSTDRGLVVWTNHGGT